MEESTLREANKRAHKVRRAVCSRFNTCCGPRKNQEAEDDAEDARLAVTAPIDERAALSVLSARGLLEDLKKEWATDDAWLDRVVCGKVSRVSAGAGRKNEDFFALLLLSSPAPVSDVCPELSPKKVYEESFLWPKWSQRHTELNVDYLHLAPLSGRAKTTEEPAESFDLGSLLRAPSMQANEEDTAQIIVGLDFGSGVVEFLVEGEKQAQRWMQAIQVVLMACLSAAAELSKEHLVEALQKYDKIETEKRAHKAIKAQRAVMMQMAAEAAAEAEEDEEPDVEDLEISQKKLKHMDLPTLARHMASKPIPTTMKLIEALERIAALPRVLITASVGSNPVRQDILYFWEQAYHRPLVAAIEAIWNARIREMSPNELLKLVNFIHQYRIWLEGVRITDASLGPAIAECAEVYGRRFFPSLVTLTENVAELCQPEWLPLQDVDGHSRLGTSAPIDLFFFLGPPIEAALSGAAEMRVQAAEIVDGAFLRYQKFLKWRLLDAVEEERSGEKHKHHDEEMKAAFMADAEEFAENCNNVLTEVGELGDAVADVFHRVEGRFRTAAAGFCEALVTDCLRTSGAARIFGLPPNPITLVQQNLRKFLSDHMSPMVAQFQGYMAEPWRSRFALRLITRFVALELFILTHVPAVMNKSKDKKKLMPTVPELVTCLIQHEKAFREKLAHWVDDASNMFVETRLKPLKDVIEILNEKPEKLVNTVSVAVKRHSGALNGHVLKALLSLRDDLNDQVRNQAIAIAASSKAKKVPSTDKKMSFVPVDEARFVVTSGNAFHWAMDLEWVNEIFGLNKKRDLSEVLSKRPRPKRVKRKTDEEKHAEKGAKVLSGDAFGGKLQFHLYNKKLDVTPARGITVVVISEDLNSMKEYQSFDTSSSDTASDELEQFLEALAEGTVIMVGTLQDGAAKLTNDAREALAKFGARKVCNLGGGDHYAMVGMKITDDTAEENEAEECVTTNGLAKAVQVLKAEKRAGITSAGFDDGGLVEFSLEGAKLEIEPEPTQGFTIVVLDEDDEVKEAKTFDTCSYEEEVAKMEEFLEQLPDGTRIMVGIMEDGATTGIESIARALGKFGAAKIANLNHGDSYALLARKGISIAEQDPVEVHVVGGEGRAVIDQMAEKTRVTKKKQKQLTDLDDFLSGISLDDPVAAPTPAAAAPLAAGDSESSDESSDDDAESEDDDECLRGFLYLCDDAAASKAAYSSATNFATLRWVSAAKASGQVVSHISAGGWREYYVAVRKDMRGNRTLHWYENMDDTVCQGSVPLAEMDQMSAKEDKLMENLPAVLELPCTDITGVARTIEFRSPWMHECNFWEEKLKLLKEREMSDLSKAPERGEGVVLVLQPLLRLRDPERMGATLEEENAGKGRKSDAFV